MGEQNKKVAVNVGGEKRCGEKWRRGWKSKRAAEGETETRRNQSLRITRRWNKTEANEGRLTPPPLGCTSALRSFVCSLHSEGSNAVDTNRQQPHPFTVRRTSEGNQVEEGCPSLACSTPPTNPERRLCGHKVATDSYFLSLSLLDRRQQ